MSAARTGVRILFVCTGNLCRSPLAEGMLRSRLEQLGQTDIAVDSAGMHAEAGAPPDPLAVAVAADYGADISGLRARPVTPEDFDEFDHLIAMDLGHLDYLRATQPSGNSADIRLLLDDVGDFKNLEIPDPYRKDREAFEFSARLIDVGINRLLDRLLN